jgi:lysophospholipase L1-like esterase
MKSVPVVSPNFLERIAQPTSRFHSDYLAYKRGRITRAELIARLPHIAMIGDSVCMDFHISSAASTFWRARTCRGKNWFLDVDPTTGIRSVTRRLEKFTPFVAVEYAGVGALVDDERQPQSFFRRILGTHNFSRQISHLLAARRFPDLILLAIGHNNVDWAWHCPANELEQAEERLREQSRCFRDNFARQLRRLVERACMQRHRVAVIVYGLVNFEAYFKGRKMAEQMRMSDSALYPHLETTYKYFTSFRPEYRHNLVRLAMMINEELRATVAALACELERVPILQVRYSDALAKADLSHVELLHAIDGWHASAEGHNVLAQAAFSALVPSLEFLGIGT